MSDTSFHHYHHSTKNDPEQVPQYSEQEKQSAQQILKRYQNFFDRNHKRYPRMDRIMFDSLTPIVTPLSQLLVERSSREPRNNTISKNDLSQWLGWSVGRKLLADSGQKNGRMYPSGGARYPVEPYLILAKGIEDILPGIYHYHATDHALERLWDHCGDTLGGSSDNTSENQSCGIMSNYLLEDDFDSVDQYHGIIALTARFRNTTQKYGNRGYRHLMLEAGHMGHNLLLCATALGLSVKPYGGTQDKAIEKALDIDGANESLVYTIVLK